MGPALRPRYRWFPVNDGLATGKCTDVGVGTKEGKIDQEVLLE